MKTILKFSLLSILAIIGFTSCEDDPIGGGSTGGGNTDTDPSVLLLTEAGFVDFEATIMPGETFSVKMQADMGSSPLNAIRITEDGSTVDLSRITVDGVAASANPILLFNADKNDFTKEIDVVSQSGEGTSNYTFSVEDEAMNTAASSVSIKTERVLTPPTIIIEGSGMPMVSPGTNLKLPITVSDVTTPLLTIGVLQDGVYIENEARLSLGDSNGTLTFMTNPQALQESDVNGFMKDLFIVVHADADIKTYTIEITDEAGGVYTRELTIETGSSLTVLDGVLFNAAGPAGTGGLDLDEGIDTGSDDMRAEIKDEGIDGGPVESNWIRRISGANGAEVRHLFPNQNGLPEDFTFESVSTTQELASIWDNGLGFVDTNADGDEISLRVEQGDMFMVLREGKYYMIRVATINETINNNDDNYMIDIRH